MEIIEYALFIIVFFLYFYKNMSYSKISMNEPICQSLNMLISFNYITLNSSIITFILLENFRHLLLLIFLGSISNIYILTIKKKHYTLNEINFKDAMKLNVIMNYTNSVIYRIVTLLREKCPGRNIVIPIITPNNDVVENPTEETLSKLIDDTIEILETTEISFTKEDLEQISTYKKEAFKQLKATIPKQKNQKKC